MKTFTKQFMKDNRGCYSLDELNACSFMKQEEITLKSIFDSEIPLKDKYWFLCHKVATEEQNKKIAIDVAEMVLPIWEKRYPDDKRPQNAIEAAKQYLAGHISRDELIIKRVAYAVAHTAANADAAADAAAAAVYVAVYAAGAYGAAVYAADANAAADAAEAADDAVDAAVDAAIRKQLEDYLMKLL